MEEYQDAPSVNAQSDRMDRLSRRDRDTEISRSYTNFVRLMRLALPLAAVVVIAFLFISPGLEEQVVVNVEETTKAPDLQDQKIAKNELLNPKFESTDNNNQPYQIVAERAIQGELNKDLIMLESPVGVMTMSDGVKVTMKSEKGAYRQDTERFFLEGNVMLEHAEGYSIQSSEAHIDMKKNFAWSEKDVNGSGPDLSIAARGVQANGETGEIIFSGPATLTLDKGFEGIE